MMIKAQTLKGFRDFAPPTMEVRNMVIKKITDVFESYGFREIKTPTLEYASVLLGKYGAEAEKLMYIFKDPGKREVGLKYDLTVPLARYCNQQKITTPFKRYQIQPVFRAEKPQRGRYREIYQCDIDCVGSYSPIADAEVVAIISKVLENLDFKNYTIKINSRKVLFELLEGLDIKKSMQPSLLQTIDKLDKKSKREVEEELIEKKLSPQKAGVLLENISKASMDTSLKEIISYAGKMGARNVAFEPSLVRGLDYYTGTIFEAVVEKPQIGSVAGGGRYDTLIADLGGPRLPAVGVSFGLDRLCDVIENLKLFGKQSEQKRVLVSVFSHELLEKSILVSETLRKKKINCLLYPEADKKLDKQLKYASNTGFDYVIIIGPQEVENNLVSIKDLADKSQKTVTLAKAIEILKSN